MDGAVLAVDKVAVPVDTIDHLMASNQLKELDLLKIDTQGSEMSVLAGASTSLKERRIKFIIAELLFVPLYEKQSFFAEVTHHLWELGYDLFDFYDFVYGENGQVKWGDGLFRLR